ncbi:MarR family transcriptional regulator [Aliiroseovarius sp.]|uniref:MarR family winged helix-turn-helix transcriptional regulator n=1 Tax=Aliiroseovarius sp. TaxID=1872442 RepID=UPI0026172B4D|nr:MarR family transcriptional regulator [Aliiroseovarius sp.]
MSNTPSLAEQAFLTRTTSCGWMIQQLSSRYYEVARRQFDPLGLKLEQFILMMAIAEAENQTQTELGQRVRIANYAVTRALDGLEELGLVERRADAASRRSRRIFLTDRGRALAPRLFDAVQAVNDEVLAPLPPEDRDAFARVLSQLVNSAS